jgi:hypothetical protein
MIAKTASRLASAAGNQPAECSQRDKYMFVGTPRQGGRTSLNMAVRVHRHFLGNPFVETGRTDSQKSHLQTLTFRYETFAVTNSS